MSKWGLRVSVHNSHKHTFVLFYSFWQQQKHLHLRFNVTTIKSLSTVLTFDELLVRVRVVILPVSWGGYSTYDHLATVHLYLVTCDSRQQRDPVWRSSCTVKQLWICHCPNCGQCCTSSCSCSWESGACWATSQPLWPHSETLRLCPKWAVSCLMVRTKLLFWLFL